MTELDNFSGTTFAGCRIDKKIGQGGMGVVYTAHHLALDKTVCVKVLSPDLAREGRNIEFFLREARSAAKLEHANIVRVYNFGQENGLHYIIMSYIEGCSLADIVAKTGPMSTDTATGIMLEVFDALRHAHSNAIIHRDIKPSNILLSSDGHASIVDFGLARSTSEEKLLTMAGEMIGTAYFMSPEQGLAGQVDHRADLYSAGATFFYLLTGKYPFDGKTYIEVVHKHIGEPLPSIIVLKPDIPLWVSRVLDLLMRKNPKDRYQSAAQVTDEIKRLRAAEKSGTAFSNERDIELPELEKRLAGEPTDTGVQTSGDAPSRPAALQHEMEGTIKPGASVSQGRKTLGMNEPLSRTAYTFAKMALYCAITLSAIGSFLLAGSSGAPGLEIPLSLRSPFSASPAGTGFFLAIGLGLLIWATIFKPSRSPITRFFLLAASGMAAYAAAAYTPAPGATDTASKALFCLKSAAAHKFSESNFLIYSMSLFIAASAFSLKRHWALKAAAALSYLFSLFFTCMYFKGWPPISPENGYLALTGAAALLGTAAVLTQKRFIVFFNAPLFFIAANAFVFAMFTTPHINAIVEVSISREHLRTQGLDREASYTLMARGNIATEFDSEGQEVENQLMAPPKEIRPATRGELNRAAWMYYYKALASRLGRNVLNTAGLIYISSLLLLMANFFFAGTVLQCRESNAV